MKRDELLTKIREAIRFEEDAYPIYADHLTAILEWSGLSPENQIKISSSLEKLKIETKKHYTTLLDAQKYVLKEKNKDVF